MRLLVVPVVDAVAGRGGRSYRRHLGVLVRWPARRLERLRDATVGDLVQLHAEPVRVDVPLAVLAGFLDEDLPIGEHGTDEALVRAHVPPLGVRVDDVPVGPLAQAAVFPFWKGRRDRLERNSNAEDLL